MFLWVSAIEVLRKKMFEFVFKKPGNCNNSNNKKEHMHNYALTHTCVAEANRQMEGDVHDIGI